MSIKTSYNPQQVRMLKSFRRLFDAKWKSICKLNNYQNEEELENDADNFFPKVIVNCRYNNEIQNGRSQKGIAPIQRSFYRPGSCHEILQDFLDYLFFLYSSQTEEEKEKKGIYWGTCAEDDAANKVLTECEKNLFPLPQKMSDLRFTVAIRPRTRERIPYCTICEKIFG
jgi:hypothetical protein